MTTAASAGTAPHMVMPARAPNSLVSAPMIRALSRARVPFRTACVCRGVNSLIATVTAGR